MTIGTLINKLKKIKAAGYVKTHRRGNTGIGKTLEDLLGIKENNIPLHDIAGVAELKAGRRGSGSMLTLFTLEPSPPGGDRDRFLLDNFGYSKRKNGRSKELHSTLSSKKFNNQQLRLLVEKDKIRIQSDGRRLNIYWEVTSVAAKFAAKLPALVHVLADTKIVNGNEYFHFNEAYLLTEFSFDLFKKRVKNDDVVVDLRMYYRPNGTVRNHGTGFRVKTNKLDDCFLVRKRLL